MHGNLTQRAPQMREAAIFAGREALLHETSHLDTVNLAAAAVSARGIMLHCPGLEIDAFAPTGEDMRGGGRCTPGFAHRNLHPHATGGRAHPAPCPSTCHVLPARASRLSLGGRGAVHPLARSGTF